MKNVSRNHEAFMKIVLSQLSTALVVMAKGAKDQVDGGEDESVELSHRYSPTRYVHFA